MLHGKAPPHGNARQWGWWARKRSQMIEEEEAFLEQAWLDQRKRSKQLRHHFRFLGPHQQCSNSYGVMSAAHTKSSYCFTGLLCWESGGTNTTTKGQNKEKTQQLLINAQWIRASQLWWRPHHSTFWAETEFLLQGTLKLKASGVEEVACHWKEGHRKFFPSPMQGTQDKWLLL